MSETSPSIVLPVSGSVSDPVGLRKGRRAQRRLTCGLVLALTDITTVQLTMAATAGALSLLMPDLGLASVWTVTTFGAVSVAAMVAAVALGVYDPASLTLPERLRLRFYSAAILPWLALSLVTLVAPVTLGTVVTLAVTTLAFLPIGLLTDAWVRNILVSRLRYTEDVLVLGSRDAAKRVADGLLANPRSGLRPVGYCAMRADTAISGQVPFLGPIDDIAKYTDTADVAVVAYSPEIRSLDIARLPFDRIIIVPDGPDLPTGCLRSRAFPGASAFDFLNPARTHSHRVVKRLFDLLVAVPLLIIALPFMALAALAIWIVSPGPVFYVQRRVGWNGRSVSIWKLRSMYLDAERRLEELLRNDPKVREEWQTYVKLSHDPRILPVIGNFLRRSSIDELPQLWNVVRGDISLVGPRPFPAYHVERFSPEFQKLRCSVLPGLTGLWQVSVRNGADLKQQEDIDTFYIRNWSLWLDFYIVLRTFPAVLSSRGAR